MARATQETYDEYRKRVRKKHSPELIWKFLERYFKHHDLDINQVANAPILFKTIFWSLDLMMKNHTTLQEDFIKHLRGL